MFRVRMTSKSGKVKERKFRRFEDASAFAEWALRAIEPIHIQIDDDKGCIMWAMTASDATTELVALGDGKAALRLRGYQDIVYKSSIFEGAAGSEFLDKTTGELVRPEVLKRKLDEILNELRRWYAPESTSIVREFFRHVRKTEHFAISETLQ